MTMKLEQIVKAARTQAAKDLMVNADVLESADITRDAILISDTCEIIDNGVLQDLQLCVEFALKSDCGVLPVPLDRLTDLLQLF